MSQNSQPVIQLRTKAQQAQTENHLKEGDNSCRNINMEEIQEDHEASVTNIQNSVICNQVSTHILADRLSVLRSPYNYNRDSYPSENKPVLKFEPDAIHDEETIRRPGSTVNDDSSTQSIRI